MQSDEAPSTDGVPGSAPDAAGSVLPPAIAFYTPGQYSPQQSVGYLMKQVMNSVLARADARLAEFGLTHAQWLPLYKLVMHEGHTMASLSRDLGIDPGAMTRSLDRLEAKGLVRRERSKEDRRVVLLTLTDEGRTVASRVPAVMADVLNSHLAGFNEAEWHQLLAMLQRMLANGELLRGGCGTGVPDLDNT